MAYGLYRVGDGFDVALVSLTILTPQPRSEGIKPARRVYGGDGSVYDSPLYLELEWDVIGSDASYQALIDTIFGVSRPLTNEVTVYARNQYDAFARYNGIAVSPENGRDVRRRNSFRRDLTVLIKALYLAS